MKNLKPGSAWHHSHQILPHAVFIAGYDLFLINLALKAVLKPKGFITQHLLSPQDCFECSSLLINTN